ncbi:hypothetical protein HMPREF9413_3672 [Paenibacillus sp. HGF7]|nr:hypothetical protein HMPREF9413_3672 [Paenibacillus sp. HGF7]
MRKPDCVLVQGNRDACTTGYDFKTCNPGYVFKAERVFFHYYPSFLRISENYFASLRNKIALNL